MVYVDANYLAYTATLCGDVKRRSYELAGLSSQARPRVDLLDIGCGIGADTLGMARQLAPDSRIVGVDFDAAMVERANQRAREQDLSNVSHLLGDAMTLSFCAEFDVVRAERLFQHLRDPAGALALMVRAARPGGKVILVDTDWSTLRCTVFDAAENAAIAARYSKSLTFDATSARLTQLALEQGLGNVESQTIGIALTYQDYLKASKIVELMGSIFSEEQCAGLTERMRASDAPSTFGVIDVFLVSGIRVS